MLKLLYTIMTSPQKSVAARTPLDFPPPLARTKSTTPNTHYVSTPGGIFSLDILLPVSLLFVQ